MAKIEMLTSVGGFIEEHDSPKAGDVLEVSDETAEAWADGERAKAIEAPKPKRKPAAKKATKKVETAAGDSGAEKR